MLPYQTIQYVSVITIWERILANQRGANSSCFLHAESIPNKPTKHPSLEPCIIRGTQTLHLKDGESAVPKSKRIKLFRQLLEVLCCTISP